MHVVTKVPVAVTEVNSSLCTLHIRTYKPKNNVDIIAIVFVQVVETYVSFMCAKESYSYFPNFLYLHLVKLQCTPAFTCN